MNPRALAIPLVCLGLATSASAQEGRVLVMHSDGYLYVGTEMSRDGDQVKVDYFAGQTAVAARAVRPYGWAVGMELECSVDRTDYKKHVVESFSENGELVFYKDGNGDYFSIGQCRQYTDEVPRAAAAATAAAEKDRADTQKMWDDAKKYAAESNPFGEKMMATYKTEARMPPAGMSDPATTASTLAAFRFWLSSSDVAATADARRCVITSTAWRRWDSGSEHTGRSVETACGVEIRKGVCLLMRDACYQEYEGMNRYSSCNYSRQHGPAKIGKIDCKAIK